MENAGSILVGSSGTTSSFTMTSGTLDCNGELATVFGNADFAGGEVTIANSFSAATATSELPLGRSIIPLAGGTFTAAGGIADFRNISGYGTIGTGSGVLYLEGSGSMWPLDAVCYCGRGKQQPSVLHQDNSTLKFSGAVGSGVSVTFAGTNDVLSLSAPNNNSSPRSAAFTIIIQ